jgi:hypothetical protein
MAAANWAGRVHLGLQDTPPSPAWDDAQTIVGTWLSLVERTLGVGEVASSNLVVPTIYFQSLSYCRYGSWVQAWVRKGPIASLPERRSFKASRFPLNSAA